MCPQSIPVFLGNAGIGLPHGMIPPQIRGFDVYYKFPIIVGFHVIGNKDYTCAGIDVLPQEVITDTSVKVVGFYCFASNYEQVPELIIEISQQENYPKILGFYALAISNIQCANIMPLVQIDIKDNSPRVLGFYAMGVT